jgi:primosomal protein N' (replication factor Y)
MHHALVRAAMHDAEGFLREEHELRRAPPYPPELHLVNLIVSGEGEAETGSRAAEVADWCNALVARHALPVTVLGPAPCPLARIKDRWRWHVLLKGSSGVLGRIVRYAARRLPRVGGTRVVIDRDPVSLL